MKYQEILRAGYNKIAEEYQRWSGTVRLAEREFYTQMTLDSFQQEADILEIGCGTGIPTTKTLSRKFMVTGIDISDEQVRQAEENIPQAVFIRDDVLVRVV